MAWSQRGRFDNSRMAVSPQSSDDGFAIGSVLDGRYRVDAVLGTGGMGRVYRAEHLNIGRAVAIKVLHADLTRNREASQRFQREAIASGRLDHPNIVGVSDFGVLDTGACYLVMEVLEGESLGERLVRDKRLPWGTALDILRGVLHGLRHAHERGVVHRDIKPDNVYLAHKDGESLVKILDFGIAKLYAGSEDDPASTRAGLTVGTPAYLSPEQAVGSTISPASDLYSATVVLYEMLAGRAPFEEKDPLMMLGAHVSRPPPRFADIAPGLDIPPPLEDIVQRGLRKLPAERIGNATDYLALLDAFSPPLPSSPWTTASPGASNGAAKNRAVLSAVQAASSAMAAQRAASVPRGSGAMAVSGASRAQAASGAAEHTVPLPVTPAAAMVSAPEPRAPSDRPGTVSVRGLSGAMPMQSAVPAPAPPPAHALTGTQAAPAPTAPSPHALTAAQAAQDRAVGRPPRAGEAVAAPATSAAGPLATSGPPANAAPGQLGSSGAAAGALPGPLASGGMAAGPLASSGAGAAGPFGSSGAAAGAAAEQLASSATAGASAPGGSSALPIQARSSALPVDSMSVALAIPRVSVEMGQLPRAARAMTFVDTTEPIPLTWIVRSGVVIAAVMIGAIALAIGAHCRGAASAAHEAAGSGSAAHETAGSGSAVHGTAGSGSAVGSSPASVLAPGPTAGRVGPDLPVAAPAPHARVEPPVKSSAPELLAEPGAVVSRPAPVPGRPAVSPVKAAAGPVKAAGAAGPGKTAGGAGSARKPSGR